MIPDLNSTPQVWLGTAVGLLLCIVFGTAIVVGIHGLGAERLAGAEDVWEGVFSLAASLIITVMGAVLLRASKLQDKWRVKLTRAMNASEARRGPFRHRIKHLGEKYAMFLLPLVTVLREGFEAVLFISGVGLGLPASSIPLPAIAGLSSGAVVGILIYK